MIYFRPQSASGGFALVTALLTGVVIGRALGISFGEALYLSVVGMIELAWVANRLMLHREHDVAEE